MKHTDQQRAESDKRVADDIQEFGCHVISVFDPEELVPSFSYSVGIRDSAQAPDAIVIGVRPSLGHYMINEYSRQLERGVQFKRGVLYPDFLEGFSVYVEPARQELVQEYVLGCRRYYRAHPFSVVQIIYPTTQGVWPWQKSASEWFVQNQPMFGRKRPDRQ